MTKSIRPVKKEENRPVSLDRVFEGFSKELEDMRVPLCDMKDLADRYELHVEVPGIDKEKIDIRATGDTVEISGEQSEKSEKKRKDYYVYNERSRRSFYRQIRMPEEIDPSRVSASMKNGILVIGLPKTGKPRKSGATKVEIK